MPRISLTGFKDPRRRARYIIWTGAAVMVMAAVMILALGITSTRWFCAEGCHKVQDDTILSYERSPHANISCMACHMPANAGPVTFMLHKAEALGELYLTVTDNFHLPLNGNSHYALYMGEEQCTQCHTLYSITPSAGIIIDHEAHSSRDIQCTVCHNRLAHVEDFELTLSDPNTGEPNQPHDDFMTMDACFRCHVQEGNGPTGRCAACHTPELELMPDTHRVDNFVRHPGPETAEHAAQARDQWSSTEAADDEVVGKVAGFELRRLETVDTCGTCHAQAFCTDCHGVDIPHPDDFTETHPAVAEQAPDSCAQCHLVDAAGMNECSECHHQAGNPSLEWLPQHSDVVGRDGAQPCFDCHDPRFCANCHVNIGRQ